MPAPGEIHMDVRYGKVLMDFVSPLFVFCSIEQAARIDDPSGRVGPTGWREARRQFLKAARKADSFCIRWESNP
jgi:hypothetical protein